MYGFLPRLSTRLETMVAAAPAPRLRRDTPPEPAPALPLSLDGITDTDTFEAITEPAADIIANGRVIKFLIDARSRRARVVHFVNGNFTAGGDVPRPRATTTTSPSRRSASPSRWRSSTS